MHTHRQWMRLTRSMRELSGALALMAIAVIVGINFSAVAAGASPSSVEVAFADVSASGLAIVPASCPSDPHIDGECDPVCPGGTFGAYPNCDYCPAIAGIQSSSDQCTPDPVCPSGSTGTPPNCDYCPSVAGIQTSSDQCTTDPDVCPSGTVGTPPNCDYCPAIAGIQTSSDQCTVVPDVCPSGTVGTPPNCDYCPSVAGIQTSSSQCTPDPDPECPTGTTGTYPNCDYCPAIAGIQTSFDQCGSGPTCPDGSPIPPSGVCGGSACVSGVGNACTSAANSCGMRGNGSTQCDGSCSATVPSNNLCPVRCWDGSVVSGGDDCPACPEGYRQVGNACIPPDQPIFDPFDTDWGFRASGQLEVRPSLVRSGDTTRVFWNVRNVRSCTVTGSNGDSWTGASSGTAGRESDPITSRTTYTLFCRSLVGATPASITQTKTVNIIPQWYEPASGNQ